MGDQDFNFNPPPRREAKKVFEPPPWEQEQFDELARRKEAERVTAEAIATAVAEQATPVAPTVQPGAGGQDGEPANESVPTPMDQTAAEAEEDPNIQAMLIGLKSEEPPFGEEIWKVSIVAGAVLAAIGAVFLVWGFVAMAATRGAGVTASLGGMILGFFGLMFASVGVWIVFRTLRQRGVL